MKRNLFSSSTPPETMAQTIRKEVLLTAVRLFGAFIIDYLRNKTDEQTAKDLSQELWLHVYQKFPVEQFCNLRRLRQKAYQVFVTHTRKEAVRSFVEYRDRLPELEEDSVNRMPQNPAEAERLHRQFWELFPGVKLTEQQKKVFFMAHIEGYTLDEISEKMHIPMSTVHDWIKLVKKLCKQHFKKELL